MTLAVDRGVVDDVPRNIREAARGADRIFRQSSTAVGAVVLVITGGIGIFLGYQLIPTFHAYGAHFFTGTEWNPERNIAGIATVLLDTVEVALIALTISFPLALGTALFITEFAPHWIKATLVSLVDLMAAIPSIIYGLWGLLLINPNAIGVARWINQYFGWFPLFRVHANPSDPNQQPFIFGQSPFIAGLVVSMMVLPLAAAVMRGVFAQAPVGEREAAYALGSTRWGMIRSVVLPFGRGGIIGGTMLALGRALGETVAVLLILQPDFTTAIRPLQAGGTTVASLIANDFGDASSGQLSALLAAGFVLFVITLIVNTLAAVVVNRSRSGAGVDI